MKNYFDQRANLPGWYANRDPFLPEAQEFLNIGYLLFSQAISVHHFFFCE